MSEIRGMLTTDQLAQMVQEETIDTVLVVFTDLYGRFLGKRIDAEFFLDNVAKRGAHACDYLLTTDMEMEPVSGYEFANWKKGYGDFHMIPDFSTLRLAAWLLRTAMVICDIQGEMEHSPVAVAPRSLLKKQVELASSLGYEVMVGSELEYYIFQDSYRGAAKKSYKDLDPVGWYIEDYHMLQGTREEDLNGTVRNCLRKSGVPVESSKGEWGLGQHELNVRYADAMSMADRHCILKQCMKETADQLGCSVTFMAKCSADQAGSSNHIHLSLWKGGKNRFQGRQPFGPITCSSFFRWFLGGWLIHIPDFMVFYAPTVNSYKRYQASSWAPTRIAWSYDNRTAGFRVIGDGDSLRIECRIPGADSNPYLAFAAAIASGLDGIIHKIEPPEIFKGDAYSAQNLPHVPKNLQEAVEKFEQSKFAKDTLGEDVVRHYAHFFQTEQNHFENAVTDWERLRYFERI
jgi:glutamine synthetase